MIKKMSLTDLLTKYQNMDLLLKSPMNKQMKIALLLSKDVEAFDKPRILSALDTLSKAKEILVYQHDSDIIYLTDSELSCIIEIGTVSHLLENCTTTVDIVSYSYDHHKNLIAVVKKLTEKTKMIRIKESKKEDDIDE